MYGLKQSERSWNKKLNIIPKEMGLLQSKADQCIFHKMNGTRRLIIAVYVDDLLILSSDNKLLETTKQRLQQHPERRHWTALEFRKDEEQFLEAYSDAHWANELDNRRSITGNVIKFEHGAISWSKVLWLRMLAQEIDATAVSQPTIVYCDNKSAIDLAETSAYRQRTKHTKHIDVRHHFLREKIEDGKILINHIPTDKMTADSLTKPLFKQKHETCAKNMGLVTFRNMYMFKGEC
ncbi:Reverse transcriptase (RNA-dependent DNA polymerase) [Popillia japonica]|uniref:Reverse transcriptase (RNA-dependent DNA polymerase) n=1 Tax=Popillia japonica TaxID=7064 RepID=A0AAW1IWV8_POPJA